MAFVKVNELTSIPKKAIAITCYNGAYGRLYVSSSMFPVTLTQSMDLLLDVEEKKGKIVFHRGLNGTWKINKRTRQITIPQFVFGEICPNMESKSLMGYLDTSGDLIFDYAGDN